MPWPHLPHLFQGGAESPTPSELTQQAFHIFDLLARVQLAQDALKTADNDLAAALRQWATRPISLVLSVEGGIMTSPTTVDVNDVSFSIRVQYGLDAAGEHVQDPGPFTWTINPTTAASPAPGADAMSQQVNVTPADPTGAQQDFTVTATDPNGVSGSLACHPVAGGPTSLVIGVG